MKPSGQSCRENAKPRLSPRHCEEPLRRSNPFLLLRGSMDCFVEPVIRRRFAPTGWLAMTRKERATFSVASPASAGDPVHRGFSAQALLSLEYWIARSRLRRPPSSEGGLRRSRGYAAAPLCWRAEALAKAASRAMTGAS
jgi:hypothetical protein